MKLSNIFALALVVLFLALGLSGCTTETEEEQISNLSAETITSTEMQKFLLSVDSLNAQYPAKTSRGNIRNGIAISAADGAGKYLGRLVGRWAGAAIGSTSANPFVVYGASEMGKVVGGFVGSTVASGCTYAFLHRNRRATSTPYPMANANFNIDQIGSLKEDSLGYYHNYVMAKIIANEDKYFHSDSVNINLLYDDIILYCNECGYDASDYISNNNLKVCLLKYIKELISYSQQYEDGLLEEQDLINKQITLLKKECSLNEDETKLYKDFAAQTILQCSKMDEQTLDSYSKGLNSVILSSDLSLDQKKMAASSAQIAINSTLCWK